MQVAVTYNHMVVGFTSTYTITEVVNLISQANDDMQLLQFR